MINFITGDGFAAQTEAANTRIRRALGGGIGFTHLLNLRYTDTGTAHVITIMKGATRTKAVGSVAAAGTLLTTAEQLLDGAGSAIATSDVIAVQLDNGVWHVTTVSSLDTPKTGITMANAVPTGRTILDGAKVVNYGVAGDAMHAQQQYTMGAAASAVNVPSVAMSAMSMCKAPYQKEPLVIDSNNATNAGTINYANCGQTLH